MEPTTNKSPLKQVIAMGFFSLGLSLPFALRAEVILIKNPTEPLSQALATWTEDANTAEPRWRPRVGSDRSFVTNGLIHLSGEGRLEVPEAFTPADFPYIRFRAGGSAERERLVRVSASPNIEANVRSAPAPLINGGGQISLRLPPERILAREAYDGEGLKLEIENATGKLALDYIFADVRPAYALAEFDSDFPEPYALEKSGFPEASAIDGCLRLKYSKQIQIQFKDQLPTNRDYDTLELRLRIPADEIAELTVAWQAGDQSGQHTFPLTADNDFQTYRLHLYKESTWPGRPEQVSLHFDAEGTTGNTAVDIDYVRLYDLPNPGGGNVSNGLLSLDKNSDDWRETARLIDRWRFVAGQSIGPGNAARMAKALGKSFRRNHIRWESDMATWLFCAEDRSKLPTDPSGEFSVELTARNGYSALNQAAQALERFNVPMDAVHFDGLFKRLLMPEGWPNTGRDSGGGFLEASKGDYAAAYRLVAETFCQFMVLARTEPDSLLKDTRFYIQPNFHYWAWSYGRQDFERIFTTLPDPGNFREMMDAFEATDHAYAERGAYEGDSPFAGYGADWVFMDPQKRRLTAYEWYATEICGREFNVVNNGTLKGDTPAERSQESLDYLRQFRAEGGRPTSYTPYFWQTTWRHAPDYGENGYAVLPEDEPGTVTWTLRHSARIALFMDR